MADERHLLAQGKVTSSVVVHISQDNHNIHTMHLVFSYK